jgi:hypothetical protein
MKMSELTNDFLLISRDLSRRGYTWHAWEVVGPFKHKRGSVIYKHARTGAFFACHFIKDAIVGSCIHVTWFVGGQRYSVGSMDIENAVEGVLKKFEELLTEKQTDNDLRLTEDAATFDEPD